MSEKISVGGQALIEGIMMRAGEKVSIVVRKNNGEFAYQDKIMKSNKIISKIPILRGIAVLIASMAVGMKALSFSAEYFAEGDENYEMGKFDKWVYDKFGDKAENIIVAFSMVMALVLATLLFGIAPTFIIYSFISWESVLVRVMYKIILLPLVAGFSYEIIKIAGKTDNIIFRIISYPGMMMQKITTSEPDDGQLEVALEALKRAISNEN